MIDLPYIHFWQQLPKAYGGGKLWTQPWPRGDEVAMRAHMLKDDRCHQLLNLFHGLKQHFSEYERFGIGQIARCMSIESDWMALAGHCEVLRQAMARKGHPADFGIGRYRGPGKRPESFEDGNASMDTRWHMFLNEDLDGGELFLPTRGIYVRPRTGLAVSWSDDLPWGIAPITDGYGFFLSGRGVRELADKERWPAYDRVELYGADGGRLLEDVHAAKAGMIAGGSRIVVP